MKTEVEEGVYGLVGSPNIARIRFGQFELDTWYGSAVYFGKDQKSLGFKQTENVKPKLNKDEIWLDKLYICDDCFKYTDEEQDFTKHVLVCDHRDKQQGKIVYKEPKVTIRRVRGFKYKLFTQNLCLFTKLFLDNKSIFFTIDHFDFYIVYDNDTNKPMGFFSKELLSTEQNNLACILVFPPYQRRHLGTLLIAFSYELSKAEGLVSGPEKPLSPFGLVGYLRYWSAVLCREFIQYSFKDRDSITLKEISNTTGIRHDDVLLTLKFMQVLVEDNDIIYLQRQLLKDWMLTNKIKTKSLLKPECLIID